jgi:hypothetical protein
MPSLLIKMFRTKLRLQIGLAMTVLGFLFFWLGALPSSFGQDRNPIFGFNQILVVVFGLGLLCLGGCTSLNWLWNGQEKSITADFGWRLAWTGYIIAIWSAMTDVLGFGTKTQFFGPWQERGLLVGQLVMAAGFLMIIPWKPHLPSTPETPHNGEEKSA